MINLYIKLDQNKIIEFCSSKMEDSAQIQITQDELDLLLLWYTTIVEDWKIIKQSKGAEAIALEEYIEPIIPLSEQEKEEKIKEINETFKNSIKQLTAWEDQAVIDSFEEQTKEAKIFRETGESEFISDMLRDDETIEELVLKIETNAMNYKKAFTSLYQIKRQSLRDLESN